MAFLRNDAINRVNLHSAVVAFAQNAGGLFFFVFLLKAGVSAPAALLAQAAIVAGRFAVRPMLLPLAKRLGLKPLLIAGSVLLAAQYPLLAEVRGLGPALMAVCVAASLGEVFYWMSYNAYYAAVGDHEHRGHQIAAREALLALVGIVAPLAGAWALLGLGSRVAFAAVGVVQLLSVLPLLGAPNVAVKSEAPGALRAAWPVAVLIAADGWFDAAYLFAWQMALFLTLNLSFAAYGGAMALAGLLGAIGSLVLGPYIDAGHGRRAVLIAFPLAAGLVLLRVVSLNSPAMAVTANALGALVMPLLIPALSTAPMNRSKASPCSLRFAMATEGGWDVGCFLACLAMAAMLAADARLEWAVLLAVPAICAEGALLWRMYPRRPQTLARPTLV